LVIQGERKEEKERKEKGYYASERSYGVFYRAILLPEGVKADEAKATFKDGVLEIAMPAGKLPEKHGRQLEIK
jgi:HSP20 family protein